MTDRGVGAKNKNLSKCNCYIKNQDFTKEFIESPVVTFKITLFFVG